ncbi:MULTISPECIES: hypothetical protein [Muribaculaceae]|uniref:hypothetical protein n=1 Tax=Muribaculaceae TaxID=2005473 RepID=UPI002648BB4E|nr:MULTISPECIES: hypothetical protein [Muribaculaceae]
MIIPFIDGYPIVVPCEIPETIFMGEKPKKQYQRKKPDKPLREFTWKGHTVMAYSKKDARKRLKVQMMKG